MPLNRRHFLQTASSRGFGVTSHDAGPPAESTEVTTWAVEAARAP
ncbi:hypothetical protein ACFYWY_22885 [Streptomyces sp. NPDC002870]